MLVLAAGGKCEWAPHVGIAASHRVVPDVGTAVDQAAMPVLLQGGRAVGAARGTGPSQRGAEADTMGVRNAQWNHIYNKKVDPTSPE